MKKVLILGGAGFIGFNIAKQLLNEGLYEITLADNFFRGKKDSDLTELLKNNNVKIVTGDFTCQEEYEKLNDAFDYVFMLASIVGVGYTKEIPHEVIRINTNLILNTLEWVIKSKSKKILFSSTSECYAGTINLFQYPVPTNENVPLCIEDIKNPRFSYAVTKMLGEAAFIHYSKAYNFDTTIVRYHNVYGPRMGFKHVIPQVVVRFLNNENPFKIYGYNQTRAFNFIDDAVRGTISAMINNDIEREIFHIGDMDSEITIETLVKYIGTLLNYEGKFEYFDAPTGSVNRRCPDTSKAEKYIDYKPRINWKQGVKETVNWYVNYIRNGGKIFE